MSHTNSTTNYSLPQFITTDKPAWLTDVNNAYIAIDTGMNNAQTKADSAQNDATQALTDAGNAATAASAADAKGAGAVASIADAFDPTTTYSVGDLVMYNSLLYICEVAVITPGPWTGITNWSRATVESIVDTVKTAITAATTYTVNDTIALRYKTLAGIISGGSQIVQFFIDANKIIDTGAVTDCTISGSTFRVYDATSSEQISLTDGTWSFNVRADGIACTLNLASPITSTGAVSVYFASTTTITLNA